MQREPTARTPEQPSGSLGELLCALSFASDLGMGQPMEHGLKTAYLGLRLTDALGLGVEDREAVFYGAFLKDIGCPAHAVRFAAFFAGDELAPRRDYFMVNPESMTRMITWFLGHAANDASLPRRLSKLFSFFADGRAVMKECVTTHCEVGEMFARRLDLSERTQQAVRYSYEQWDGKGVAYKLKREEAPVAARILHFAQAIEVAHSFGGAEAAKAMASERRGSDFEPALVDMLLAVSENSDVWPTLDQESIQRTVLDMGPISSARRITEGEIDVICEALADFTDIKTRQTWDYSPAVASLAVDVGRRMGLKDPQLSELRRAGLVHDVGKVGVPCAILLKEPDLSESEWERLRLHPYYSERVLERVTQLRPLALPVGAHHERVDGAGYHRRLTGGQIPLTGRILALAQAYVLEMRRQGEEQNPQAAMAQLRGVVGSQLDPDCFQALSGQPTPEPIILKRATVDARAERLTPREVEVLQQVAKGLGNRQIAQTLVISEKTVESHLEHIYGKLGVSARTSAVVFAVHNGLA